MITYKLQKTDDSQWKHNKFKGLLKRRLSKVFYERSFNFFNIVLNLAESNNIAAEIFRWGFLFQRLLISIFPYHLSLWSHNQATEQVIRLLNYILFLSPLDVKTNGNFVFQRVFVGINVLFLIFLFVDSIIQTKNDKIGKLLISFVSIYFFLLIPILINAFIIFLSREIFWININGLSLSSFLSIFTLIFLVCLLNFIHYSFVTPTLSFRKQVIAFPFPSTFMIYQFVSLFHIVSSFFGSILNYNFVLYTISLCSLFAILYISFVDHLWTSKKYMFYSQITCLVSFTVSLLVSYLIFLNKSGEYIIPFIIFCFVGVKFLIKPKVIKRIQNHWDLLENIKESPEILGELSEGIVCSLIIDGFSRGHDLCHSWKLIHSYITQKPFCQKILILYSKFSSIYPDDSKILEDSAFNLFKIKKSSVPIKNLLHQISILLQLRERTYSRTIKDRLTKIKKKQDSCLNSIRFIWECIIRNSYSNLESLSSKVRQIEKQIIDDYNYLMLLYPNNPYIVQSFANFYNDIIGSETHYEEYNRRYEMLQRGNRIRKEKNFTLANLEMMGLLNDEEHMKISEIKQYEVFDKEQSVASFSMGESRELCLDEEKSFSKRKYLESLINSVSLPSAQIAPIWIGIILCLILQISIPPSQILINNYIKTFANTIRIIPTIQKLRADAIDMTSIGLNILLSREGLVLSINQSLNNLMSDYELKRLNQWLSDENELEIALKKYYNEMESLNQFLVLLSSLDGFNPVKLSMFVSKVENFSLISPSFQSVITEISSFYTRIIEKDVSLFNESNCFESLVNLQKNHDIELNLLTETIYNCYINETSLKEKQFLLFFMLIAIIFIILISIFFGVIIKRFITEKNMVFELFKVLPKAFIVDILNSIQKKLGNKNDTNKGIKLGQREENALRILSTSSSTFVSIGSQNSFIKLIIIIIFISVYSIFSIMTSYVIEFTKTTASFTKTTSKFSSLHSDILTSFVNISIQTYLPDASYSIESPLMEICTNLQNLRTNISDYQSILYEMFSASNCSSDSMFQDDFQILDCISYDSSISFIHYFLNKATDLTNITDIISSYIFYWSKEVSRKKWIDPALETMQLSIDDTVKNIQTYVSWPVYLLLCGVFVSGIYFVTTFRIFGLSTEWFLKLLLICEPNKILESKEILKILSNDFSTNDQSNEEKLGSSGFFEILSSHLPDPLLFLTKDLIIHSCNEALGQLYGVEASTFLGKQFKDILETNPENEHSLRKLFSMINDSFSGYRVLNFQTEVIIKVKNDSASLLICLTAVSNEGKIVETSCNAEALSFIIVTMKDITLKAASRKLLQDENEKGRKLLLMILPPMIVEKLGKGETNISFSVPSASVTFIDIVSFTPWCGSNSASVIMSTLNKLFAMYDKHLNKYPELTKIKCIGDCYMAAGGVFSDINQPHTHTKQLIMFCIDIITNLEEFNKENNTCLKIRCGVNCGGPIVAGVLGIEKPTFDILGPAISMAAAMEHHGFPMAVHIPEWVYELVYMNDFNIKKRGDYVIKNQNLQTYLVFPPEKENQFIM